VTRVVFHPEAEAELLAAARFYDAQTRGLGLDFIAEVGRAARTLARNPELGHRFSRRLRRFLVRRFPYGRFVGSSRISSSSWRSRTFAAVQGIGERGTGLSNTPLQRIAIDNSVIAPGFAGRSAPER
jgi:plasmid stabilization system protein ParE